LIELILCPRGEILKMIQKIKRGGNYFLVIPGNIGAMESELWVDNICKKLEITCAGFYFNKSVNQMQFIEVEE